MQRAIYIEFPANVLLRRAAMRALKLELTETHGVSFAFAFMEEHEAAVERAIRQKLHGRSVMEIVHELNAHMQALSSRCLRLQASGSEYF